MMTFTEREVVARVRHLSVTRLRGWVECGWVQPAAANGGVAYSEADVARLQLLCTLADELDVDEETVPVILKLVDQLHGTRAALRGLLQAIERQPAEVRREIVAAYRERLDG